MSIQQQAIGRIMVAQLPINVQSYGAVGDGNSHPLSSIYATLAAAQAFYPFATALTQELDSCAIQAALNAAIINNLGAEVQIPPGTYRIDTPLTIDSAWGLRLVGFGYAASLKWYGTTTANMFELTDCRECYFGHFSVNANSPGNATFHCQNGANNKVTPTANVWEDLAWLNGPTGWVDCFLFDMGAGGNNNNDLHRFNRCSMDGVYIEAAWKIASNSNQVHALNMTNCVTNGGQYGVWCQGSGGWLFWRGGSGGNHTVADFEFDDAGEVIEIDGWNSEGSSRLIVSKGSGNQTPITVRNTRWSGNLNSDGYYAVLTARGPYVFENNDITQSSIAKPAQISFFPGGVFSGNFGGSPFLSHTNNKYRSSVAATDYVNPGAVAAGKGQIFVRDEGNSYYNFADGLKAQMFPKAQQTKSGSFTVVITDRTQTYLCSGTGTVTTPAASDFTPGSRFTVYKTDSGTATTVSPPSGTTIGSAGATSYALVNQDQYATFESDGASTLKVVSKN